MRVVEGDWRLECKNNSAWGGHISLARASADKVTASADPIPRVRGFASSGAPDLIHSVGDFHNHLIPLQCHELIIPVGAAWKTLMHGANDSTELYSVKAHRSPAGIRRADYELNLRILLIAETSSEMEQ